MPGWVGVRTFEEGSEAAPLWTPDYAGPYIPAIWEPSMALVLCVETAQCETAEEAVSDAGGGQTNRSTARP